MTRAVLKFGGDVVADSARLAQVLRAVAELIDRGWRFVLLHGGGPQIGALTERLGMTPLKVGGRRVTDDATLQIVKQVLAGEVAVDVVAAALGAGIAAVGIAGASASTVFARRRPATRVSGGGDGPVDFGHVGQILEVRAALIEHLWAGGYTPVLNPVSAGAAVAGRAPLFNINADTVAAAVAEALDADHLFLMTGVPGVLEDKDDPSTRIPTLHAAEARAAIEGGVIVGGMIPKVEEALGRMATDGGPGIRAVHILGADHDGLVGEATAPGSRGTVLIP